MPSIPTNTLLLLPILLATITSCGDLMKEPEPVVTPPPPIEHKEPAPDKSTTDPASIADKMCDQERQWAFATGLIDADQLKFFRNRNFGPVYNTPGVRQSGIEAWFKCDASLKMNGFLK
jgi:hypothetical protein